MLMRARRFFFVCDFLQFILMQGRSFFFVILLFTVILLHARCFIFVCNFAVRSLYSSRLGVCLFLLIFFR